MSPKHALSVREYISFCSHSSPRRYDLTVQSRLASNSQPSCPNLSRSRMTGAGDHRDYVLLYKTLFYWSINNISTLLCILYTQFHEFLISFFYILYKLRPKERKKTHFLKIGFLKCLQLRLS